MRTRSTRGFTMIELLIVIAIMAVLTGVTSLFFGGINYAKRLENTSNQIVTLLRTAQQRSRTQDQGVRWGVYIDNTGTRGIYTLFSVEESLIAEPGQPGTTTQRSVLPSGIEFVDPTNGTSARIIFERGSGLPTATTTIVIGAVNPSVTAVTIVAEPNGRIEY